jgi:hypothetical protein
MIYRVYTISPLFTFDRLYSNLVWYEHEILFLVYQFSNWTIFIEVLELFQVCYFYLKKYCNSSFICIIMSLSLFLSCWSTTLFATLDWIYPNLTTLLLINPLDVHLLVFFPGNWYFQIPHVHFDLAMIVDIECSIVYVDPQIFLTKCHYITSRNIYAPPYWPRYWYF